MTFGRNHCNDLPGAAALTAPPMAAAAAITPEKCRKAFTSFVEMRFMNLFARPQEIIRLYRQQQTRSPCNSHSPWRVAPGIPQKLVC